MEVAPRKPNGRVRIGQVFDDLFDLPRGRPRLRGDFEQAIGIGEAPRLERVDDLVTGTSRRDEYGCCLVRVLRDPRRKRLGDDLHLALLRVAVVDESDAAGPVGRIGLGVALRGRLDQRLGEGTADRFYRMLFAGPADRLVGQAENAGLRPPRCGEVVALIGLRQKVP